MTIEDNGTGLTSDVIENVWLEPGTDHRKPIDENGNRVINRSPIFNRVPMGEKGVGRFAVHKLGNNIKLVTRPANVITCVDEKAEWKKYILDYEITLIIDWKAFSQSKYLEDIPITWETETDRTKFHFQDNSGTLIEVTSLKEPWTRRMARSLKRNIVSMLSPKNDSTKFKIDLDFSNRWLEDFPNAQEILEIAPYKFTALLDEDYNLTFDYICEFNLNKDFGKIEIKNKTINIKGELIKKFKVEIEKEEALTDTELDEQLEIFSNSLPFGSILIESYTYDLDSETLRNYTYDSKTLKSVLKFHAGIKVFKDEMRVFNYGEPRNDWLELENRRVNNKSWISNNLNIGFVYLDSQNSNFMTFKKNDNKCKVPLERIGRPSIKIDSISLVSLLRQIQPKIKSLDNSIASLEEKSDLFWPYAFSSFASQLGFHDVSFSAIDNNTKWIDSYILWFYYLIAAILLVMFNLKSK